MKKYIFLIIAILTLTFVTTASATQVFIDGVEVPFTESSGSPFIDNSRTLVPLRVTMESFGATVSWDAETSTAIVRKGTTTVKCTIGEMSITRNGVRIDNDAAAVIKDSRTYLPIRAVLEAFGATVSWDGSVRVVSGSAGSLVYDIENAPSVTTNYWGIWSDALAKKADLDYIGAIDTIKSISNIFITKNDSSSNAMLFKHLGECYSALSQYDNASACFSREAYYWSITPGQQESRIDADRRADLISTGSQVYVRTDDKSYGAKGNFNDIYETESSILLGAYAEGDTNIYNPYNPDSFYMKSFPELVGKDMAAYLIYFPFGRDITSYQTHFDYAAQHNKIIQIALEPHSGLASVSDNDGYITNLAKTLEAQDCRFMLRFAGEMNDTTSTWYSEPSLFIEKFRLVADIFHKYAPSVPVIWAPNHYPEDNMDDYYPGDEYVDYVGISSYKMHQPITDPLGLGVDRSRWSSQLDTIYSLYGDSKPIIIVEGGASYMDYDTWADITEFASYQLEDFYTYLPIKYPNVRAVFIFNSDRQRMKFSLSNNTSYLAAYKNGIASPLYSGDYKSDNDRYIYEYYELGNNVKVKPAPTELCAYIRTPENDIGSVVYFINGVKVGSTTEAPYSIPFDFSEYDASTVEINLKAYNTSGTQVTDYTVTIKVQ